jgi:LysM repeat protein
MTRKDIILVSVIINAGLLAVLFAMAIIYDTDKVLDEVNFPALVENSAPIVHEAHSHLIAAASSGDEVDHALHSYRVARGQNLSKESQGDVFINESSIPILGEEVDHHRFDRENNLQKESIEILVKKGDSLDKIARIHGTTVGAIKSFNQLKSEKLKIGQILKIPGKQDEQLDPVQQPEIDRQESDGLEVEYYVLKSGDSPWKIAKQHHVNFEDILRLNHLDEEKARNLKVGDRIRIK